MENIERKICFEIRDYLHSKMPVQQEEYAEFTYELCFLRLLSIRTFMDLAHINDLSLSIFLDEYEGKLNTLVKEDLENPLETEVRFSNQEKCIEIEKTIINELRMIKYQLESFNRAINLLCSYNGKIISNVMALDLYDGSRFVYQTPEQICKIINYVLDINKNDDVLDIGSAFGNYLINVHNCNEYKSLNGIEINIKLSLISKIRLMSANAVYNIETGNLFKDINSDKYDKILCNYPWGMRFEKYELDEFNSMAKDMKLNWDKITNNSTDWLFINTMLTKMKDNGKAVAIMTGGPLFKVSDESYRKDLIENGLIEEIIKIPVVTRYTGVDQYVVVFSSGNNKVKFIDISKEVEKSPLSTRIIMSKVFDILSSNNDKNIAIVKNEDIANNGYLLTVDNYVGKKEIVYHNPRKLKDFVLDVFRGYQMTSQEQKELESENGEFEVLMISDIEDGQISDNLTKIDVKDNKYDRYLVKENDLIISSKGTRIKIAVVGNIGERKIIANGNLIVLRLDTTKINPLYLEMYLNSSDGQTILNQIQTGAVIISINPSRLVDITISTIPLEKQNKIAENYKNKQLQILLAKEHIKQLEQEKNDFFEKEVEELFD